MITLIFLVVVFTCSYLAFILGFSTGSKVAQSYYILLISYIGSYLVDDVSQDKFLELCKAAKIKAEAATKNKEILQP